MNDKTWALNDCYNFLSDEGASFASAKLGDASEGQKRGSTLLNSGRPIIRIRATAIERWISQGPV